MLDPGATTSTIVAQLEKEERVSDVFSEEATVIAVDMQAGNPTCPVRPLLPAEITVAIPTERNRSIIDFRESVSQNELVEPPPILILAAAIS